jgi:hypothetical protein
MRKRNESNSRDRANRGVFWLKDQTLEDPDNRLDLYVLAQEIVNEPEAAFDQFRAKLPRVTRGRNQKNWAKKEFLSETSTS